MSRSSRSSSRTRLAGLVPSLSSGHSAAMAVSGSQSSSRRSVSTAASCRMRASASSVRPGGTARGPLPAGARRPGGGGAAPSRRPDAVASPPLGLTVTAGPRTSASSVSSHGRGRSARPGRPATRCAGSTARSALGGRRPPAAPRGGPGAPPPPRGGGRGRRCGPRRRPVAAPHVEAAAPAAQDGQALLDLLAGQAQAGGPSLCAGGLLGLQCMQKVGQLLETQPSSCASRRGPLLDMGPHALGLGHRLPPAVWARSRSGPGRAGGADGEGPGAAPCPGWLGATASPPPRPLTSVSRAVAVVAAATACSGDRPEGASSRATRAGPAAVPGVAPAPGGGTGAVAGPGQGDGGGVGKADVEGIRPAAVDGHGRGQEDAGAGLRRRDGTSAQGSAAAAPGSRWGWWAGRGAIPGAGCRRGAPLVRG